MHATLPLLDALSFPSIRRGQREAPQVNPTYRCNQRCLHSHVNAGPTRSEAMTDESLALLHQVIDAHPVPSLDLTGGAPEMHPTSTASVPVRDRDLFDQRVQLQVPVRRVGCLSCGRVAEASEKTPWGCRSSGKPGHG